MLAAICTAMLIGACISVVMWIFDIHLAFYRPKQPGRVNTFYFELGNPQTSHLNIPADKPE